MVKIEHGITFIVHSRKIGKPKHKQKTKTYCGANKTQGSKRDSRNIHIIFFLSLNAILTIEL